MIEPYYESEGVTIYHGDCREVLPTLGNESFSALVTDPPYAITNAFGVQRTTHNGGKRTLQFSWDGDEVFPVVTDGINAAMGLLAPRAAAFVFCGFDTVTPMQCILRSNGFTPKPFVWTKQCPAPPAPGTWWPSAFELAIYAYRPGAWFGDTRLTRCNVFHGDSYRYGQPGKVDHPTQKPLRLMRHVVESIVPPDGICLDPFCGSGTTLVAAKMLGRRAVGCEISEAYAEMAANRCRQGVLFPAK